MPHGTVRRDQELGLTACVLDSGHDFAEGRGQRRDSGLCAVARPSGTPRPRTGSTVWRSTLRMNGGPSFPCATMSKPVGPVRTRPASFGSGSGRRDRAGAAVFVAPQLARRNAPTRTIADASISTGDADPSAELAAACVLDHAGVEVFNQRLIDDLRHEIRRATNRHGPSKDGASETRTRDLLGAIQALSQLSYSPGRRHSRTVRQSLTPAGSRRPGASGRSRTWKSGFAPIRSRPGTNNELSHAVNHLLPPHRDDPDERGRRPGRPADR